MPVHNERKIRDMLSLNKFTKGFGFKYNQLIFKKCRKVYGHEDFSFSYIYQCLLKIPAYAVMLFPNLICVFDFECRGITASSSCSCSLQLCFAFMYMDFAGFTSRGS